MSAAGFVRLHTPPRGYLRGATLQSLTPRGKWLYERSLARYKLTPDGIYTAEIGRTLCVGEIGSIESFRFIISP